jgi:triacylglycerol esterase/lipase EstA (alpha/beta hydrolase family)
MSRRVNFLALVTVCLVSFSQSLQLSSWSSSTSSAGSSSSAASLPNVKAAVIVPGFLTGEKDFRQLAQSLTARGIPTVVVPMPAWHWIPCIGGRSMRPMLERIDYTIRHVCASLDLDTDGGGGGGDGGGGGGDGELVVPPFEYSLADCLADFMDNPGGVLEVGGSAEVDQYAHVEPRGVFPTPCPPKGKIALIGHSAGGWISRVYLSSRTYGGKSYNGHELCHSIVTLGTPHADAPGAAFLGVEWCNREALSAEVRGLAVGGIGFPGSSSGELTKSAYSFCKPSSDGTDMDGDGLTPIFSSLAMEGANDNVEKKVLNSVTHFPWSAVGIWGNLFAPDLAKRHELGTPWYGDDDALDQWWEFLL